MREYLFCLAISKNKLSNSSKKGKFRALLLTAYSFAFLASLPIVREPPFAFQKFSSFPRLTKVWKEKSFRVQGEGGVPLRPPLSDEFFDSFAHLGKGRSVRKQESLGGTILLFATVPLCQSLSASPSPKVFLIGHGLQFQVRSFHRCRREIVQNSNWKWVTNEGGLKATIIKDGDSWSFGQTPGGNKKLFKNTLSNISVQSQLKIKRS